MVRYGNKKGQYELEKNQETAYEINRINKVLGRLIRLQRITTGMTLKDLSMTSGVSSSYLSRIERGMNLPSADALHRIIDPLGGRRIYLKLIDFFQ